MEQSSTVDSDHGALHCVKHRVQQCVGWRTAHNTAWHIVLNCTAHRIAAPRFTLHSRATCLPSLIVVLAHYRHKRIVALTHTILCVTCVLVRLRGQHAAQQVPGRAAGSAGCRGNAALVCRLRHALWSRHHLPLPTVPQGRHAHRRCARALNGRGRVSQFVSL